MNKIFQFMKTEKFKLFILVFIVSCIITFPTFLYSPYMDTYCGINSSHFNAFKHFIGSGRLFSALQFLIAYLTNMSYGVLNFLSPLFANLFLTGSVLCVYYLMSEGIDNKKQKVFILVASFVVFYVPFVVELFMFDEVMVMCLGILFAVYAAKKINEDNLKSYLLALLYIVLSVFCYQASISFLIPILLIFSCKTASGNIKEDILRLIKKLLFAFLFYGIAFALDLVLITIGSILFNDGTDKVGEINLLKNISHIRLYLLPLMFKTLYGYINTKLFYLLFIIAIVFGIVGIFQNENKRFNVLILIGIIVSATLMPVVPNLVMNSNLNYLDARQALTFASIPGMICLMILSSVLFSNKHLINVFVIFLSSIFLIYSYIFLVNFKQDYMRYHNDMKYLHHVQKEISKYETKNDKEIKNIYWTLDSNYSEFYNLKFKNLSSLKLTSREGWAMSCAINAYSNKNYKINYSKMDSKKYNQLSENKKFNKKSLYFDGDSLYIIVY